MASEQTPLCTQGLGKVPGVILQRHDYTELQSYHQTEPTSLLSDTSLTASDRVHVIELNELLQTLERASSIIRTHMQNSNDVVIAPGRQRCVKGKLDNGGIGSCKHGVKCRKKVNVRCRWKCSHHLWIMPGNPLLVSGSCLVTHC